MTVCATCGSEAHSPVAGECRACFMWRRRHKGQARPEERWLRWGTRALVERFAVMVEDKPEAVGLGFCAREFLR